MLTGLRERGPHPSIGDQVGGASHPTGNRLTQAGQVGSQEGGKTQQQVPLFGEGGKYK